MRTDGVFTTHHFTISFKKYGEVIYLIPFGDVHRSSPMCHEEKWLEYLAWAEKKPRCFFLGMGDYDDLASTSERFLLTDKKLHDSTIKTLENLYLNNVKRFAKECAFMKGRLVGLLGGNHYGEFQTGITTDQKLAELLGCKYLGVNALIRLSLERSGKNHAIDIFAHHGRGGGRTVGGSMNPVQQMSRNAEADIYLQGDNHQKDAHHEVRLGLRQSKTGLRLVQRKIVMARTGSFLKGYEENCPSYIVDAALPPTDLGVVKIELTPHRRERNGTEEYSVDIHASI